MDRLAGRTAWITGAGSGIGRAVALALVQEDVAVVLSGRRREPLEELAGVVRGRGGKALVAPLNVTDRPAIESSVAEATGRLGGIHILVNNAGVNTSKRAATDIEPADWERVVGVNLTGAFNCFRGVYPQMKKRGDGLIINIASIAGKVTSLVGGAAYCAAKHGMVSLTHSINLEAAGDGIRACAICPGEVATPILNRRPEPVSEKRWALMLKPEDLGELVVFIARLPARITIPEILICPTYQVSATPPP